MKEILKTYPNLVYLFIIVIALAIVLCACVALKQLGFEKIRAKVYKLFVVAENNFKKPRFSSCAFCRCRIGAAFIIPVPALKLPLPEPSALRRFPRHDCRRRRIF